MPLYRVEHIDSNGHHGSTWTGSKREAATIAAEFRANGDETTYTETDTFTVPTTKAELLALLNQIAGFPNNG